MDNPSDKKIPGSAASSGRGVTSDLKQSQNQSRRARVLGNAAVLSVLIALVAGFFGGAFIAPWYQKNVIGEPGGGAAENGKILLDEESAVIAAVRLADPAVASIVISKDLPQFEQFGSPFGEFFFSAPTGQTERQQVGAGTGFFVDSSGLLVTNKHVVNDSAAEYTVVTSDGAKYKAEVLGIDPFNDLAVVKVEGNNFPFLSLGDSDSLQLGQRVVAIGNALGEFQNTVTTGVVSGVRRNVTALGQGVQAENLLEVIQTDAAINPGNSGGPLLNLTGEVIGVNTAVSSGAQLIGFAIPINQVKKVISDVREFGRVRRPFLGVRYIIITENLASAKDLPSNAGVWVISGDGGEAGVIPGSPADAAGLREGDIILAIDGQAITPDKQLTDLMRFFSPGDRVVLRIMNSEGEERSVSAVLSEAE